MKFLFLSLLFSLGASGASGLRADSPAVPISATIVNERPAIVPQFLEHWSGKEVIASSQVLAAKTTISFRIVKVTKLQAVLVTIEALHKAGIEIRTIEGKLTAELVGPKSQT